MTGEDMQGMLFGAIETHSTPAGDPGQQVLRVCALNVNSAGTDRAQPLLEWLTGTRCNVLVLTELRPSDGGRLILAGLEADGFHVARTAGWQDSQYMAVVASRGFETAPVTPAPFDPRVATVDLATAGRQPVRVVGVYAPTNGMTAESSLRRRGFQGQFLDYLAAITWPTMCVAGDLNVVEPGHRPPLEGFEDHDYAFYTQLTQSGLDDAYRYFNPDGTDHSWASDRFGGQRLDHALISPATGPIRECRYDHAPVPAGSPTMPRSSSRSAPMRASNTTPASAVSCFSYLASVQTLRISQFPDLNYGTDVLSSEQFLAGDGPITAGALTALGHHAILGSNHVADDDPGRDVQRWLRDWGVTPAAGPRPPGRTRVNIVACDTAGNRTWFSGLRNIDAELQEVDVPLLAASPAVYIDCYEVLGNAPRNLLAASLASGADVPLNLGGSPPPAWLAAETRQRRAAVIQTNVSEAAADGAARVLDALAALDAADLAIVTLGRLGTLARSRRGTTTSAAALNVRVQQVQGAGSVFSAALIHARGNGADLVSCLRYACAAGSLWCGITAADGFPSGNDIEQALDGGPLAPGRDRKAT